MLGASKNIPTETGMMRSNSTLAIFEAVFEYFSFSSRAIIFESLGTATMITELINAFIMRYIFVDIE